MQSSSKINQIKALWAAVVVLGLLVLGLLGYIATSPNHTSAQVPFTEPPPAALVNSWQGLSLEEKLQKSSAIVFADLKPMDGKFQAIATDVLVLTPGTKIYYKPGQEIPRLSHASDGITDWGDGAVALLAGSPASVQESYSVRNGRVSGLGDIPVEELRRLALAQ
jgi:hypothetical protein